MADALASIVQSFLDLYFPCGAVPVFKSEADRDRLIYEFIAARYPKWELTPVTIKRFAWTLSMIAPRPRTEA